MTLRKKIPEAAFELLKRTTDEDDVEEDKKIPLEGLTERQQVIAKLRRRRATTAEIAEVLGLSVARVEQEVSVIKKHFKRNRYKERRSNIRHIYLDKYFNKPVEKEVENAKELLEKFSSDLELESDESLPLEGLTERQQIILRFKMRGLSQAAIGKFLGISQPMVHKELVKVRKHLAKRGTVVDQDVIIGETTSVYQEVEHRAWELYSTGDNSDKAKALSLVMQAREKHTKLLMDLGRLKRASTTNTVELHVSPLMKDLEDTKKKEIVAEIVRSQLKPLPEPEPPKEDDHIIDVESSPSFEKD